MAHHYSTAGAKASPATWQSGNLAIWDSQGVPEWGLRNHHTGPSAECRDGVIRRVRAGQRIMIALAMLVVLALAFTPALAANTSKPSDAAKEIERGAKKIGEGVKETAKGIGRTVSEGAKETGERFKEAGRAAKPPAKSVWQNIKAAASSFGQSVKNFFSRLFGKG